MISGPFIRERTWAVFENPVNGYREAIPRRAWLWMLLFGVFFLIARQAWKHVAVIAGVFFVATIVLPATGAIGAALWLLVLAGLWLYYIVDVRMLLARDYLRRGWREVDLEDATIELPF